MENSQGVSNSSPVTNNMNTGVNNSTQSAGAPLNTTASQTVPYDRFAEVNARARAAEEKAAQLEREKQDLLSKSSSLSETQSIDPNIEYYKKVLDVPDARKIEEEILRKVEERNQENERKRQMEETDRRLAAQAAELAKEYDGSDGIIPQFSLAEAMEYGVPRGIFDPRAAFEQMHKDKIIEKGIRDRQNSSPTTFVEPPSGPTNNVSPDNLKDFSELSLEEMEAKLPKSGQYTKKVSLQ